MTDESLEVLDVRGSYPALPRALKPDNIEVLVTEREPGTFLLRMEDREHDDMWLQLTLRLGGGGP